MKFHKKRLFLTELANVPNEKVTKFFIIKEHYITEVSFANKLFLIIIVIVMHELLAGIAGYYEKYCI